MFVLSQDDKARVPLGLPAAKEQAPILMHMEYRIELPDHDWVVAQKHKLIPSVYAGLKMESSGKIQYSGPTFIAVRSGKHDKSTAASHAADLERVLELDAFKEIARMWDGSVKPILLVMVDGGPDENPRFIKNFVQFIRLYDLKLYLFFIF